MGGAFGKVVSTFTDKMVAPVIGILTGGQNFNDKKIVLKQAAEEVKDPNGNIVIHASNEVDLAWGAFVTSVIDFMIVALVMFVIIKAINSLKKKEEETPAALSKTEELLTEIKELLKN
jgi:large conductance mechanosensitive channel